MPSKRDKRNSTIGNREGAPTLSPDVLAQLGYNMRLGVGVDDQQPLPVGAIVPQDDGTWMIGNIQLTPVGIQFPENLEWEQYELIGEKLLSVSGALVWWVGGWLNYGEDRKWGESVRQLMEKLDVEADTLYHYAWLDRKIKFWIRNPELSPSHHRLVAKFDDEVQRQWLDWALTANNGKQATISQMRQAIKDWEKQNSPTLPNIDTPTTPKTLISREKPREFRQFLKLASKAGQGDVKAKQRALGQIVQYRQWLDEMEQWLKG